MKKIIQNGIVDWSDEGSQSKEMLSEAEVKNFIDKLSKRSQTILLNLMAGETIEAVALFLGMSSKSIQREMAGIKKAWKSYK